MASKNIKALIKIASNDFIDGVIFVSLADLRDHNLVIPILAQTLRVPESSDLTFSQQIINYLENKNLLLVLDNFEQVLQAAPQIVPFLSQVTLGSWLGLLLCLTVPC